MSDIREAFEDATKNIYDHAKSADGGYFDNDAHHAYVGFKLAYDERQAAHAQGVKEGLERAKKECHGIANSYFACAEDAQPDEIYCAEIAGGADLCAQAIQQLIDEASDE